jgi:predicted dehydrogenase
MSFLFYTIAIAMLTNRRQFLTSSAVAAATPRNSVMGANDRIRIGAIGTGGRCRYLLQLLQNIPGNQVVALCDIYQPHLEEARLKFASYATLYSDYRKLLDDNQVDAVVIGAPDHWHTPMTIAAVQAGKDVYCEKPVTHTLEEGNALERAVRASKRVVQVGMQQRSWPHIVEAKSIVDSGDLGQITFVETHWYQNYVQRRLLPPEIDESKLDWKAFLGSAPDQPFDPYRYSNWRYYWDFGGGALTDLFTHWIDVVHWYMDSNVPASASVTGGKYKLLRQECPDTLCASYSYPGNFQVIFHTSLVSVLSGGGITLRGTKGMLRVERDGYAFYPEPVAYTESLELPLPQRQVRLAHVDGTREHLMNFLDCVRSRSLPNAHVALGIDAARPGQMGNLSYRENRIITSQSLPLAAVSERGVCY